MRRSTHLLSSMALVLASGHALVAQTFQTGALAGVVRDANGKPLGGCQVRAKSGQIERTVVTNEKGEYRLSLLNTGVWALTVVKKDYQTANGTAQLSVNDTQTANFKLALISSAVVEIISVAENLDFYSTQAATSLNSESISKVPTDLTSLNVLDGLMRTVAGVQSSGTNAFYIKGGDFNQNLFTVDGTAVNQTRNGNGDAGTPSPRGIQNGNTQVGVQPAKEFLENVEVVTGGFGAEYNAMGGVINMQTKSGSNIWTGELFYATNFPNSVAAPKYQAVTYDMFDPPAQKPPTGDKYHRYGATVSGPLVKDKLFFFLGYQGYKDTIPPLGDNAPNWNGLSSSNRTQSGPNQASLKINWFATPEHQLILSASRAHQKLTSGNQYPVTEGYEAGTLNNGYVEESITQSLNLTWNWLVSSELYVVTSYGQYKNPGSSLPIMGAINGNYIAIHDYRYWNDGPGRQGSSAGAPPLPYTDPNLQYFNYATGNYQGGPTYSNNPNKQFRMDLSWSHGNHQVKGGFQLQNTYSEDSSPGYKTLATIYNPDNSWDDPTHDPNGNALSLKTGVPTDQVMRGYYRGYYLKDLWEVMPGVRVDLGVRFDPFSLKGGTGAGVYDGVEVAKFSKFSDLAQPRLGVTWDVNHDGRSRLFANWGRTFDTLPLDTVSWAFGSTTQLAYWLSSNYDYDQNYTTGSPYRIHTVAGQPVAPDYTRTIRSGGQALPHATSLKLPHKDTLILGGDWILPEGWSAGGSWTYWTMKDMLEDSYFLNDDGSSPIPLPPGTQAQQVTWNPRPGLVNYIDGSGNPQTYESTFPDPVDKYISLNLHAQHQGESHFVSVNYTWVHHYGNYRSASTNWGAFNSGSATNPGQKYTTSEYDFQKTISSGNNEADPVHELKVVGSYSLPLGNQKLDLSPVFTWRSGFGLSKGVTVGSLYNNFAGNYSGLVQPDNRRGDMGHTPSNLNLDLGMSMTIKVGRGITIKPNCAITNVFNSRPITGYYTMPESYFGGPNLDFGRPRYWMDGRAVTAGVSVRL